MAIVTRKLADDDEPTAPLVYPWADWCLQRIRSALAAGEEPPRFKRTSKWAWLYLAGAIDRAPDLRERVLVDLDRCEVRWRRRRK